jgi:hypothetical protein
MYVILVVINLIIDVIFTKIKDVLFLSLLISLSLTITLHWVSQRKKKQAPGVYKRWCNVWSTFITAFLFKILHPQSNRNTAWKRNLCLYPIPYVWSAQSEILNAHLFIYIFHRLCNDAMTLAMKATLYFSASERCSASPTKRKENWPPLPTLLEVCDGVFYSICNGCRWRCKRLAGSYSELLNFALIRVLCVPFFAMCVFCPLFIDTFDCRRFIQMYVCDTNVWLLL